MKSKIFHDGLVPSGNRCGGLWAYLCHSYTDSKNTTIMHFDKLFHLIALNKYNIIFYFYSDLIANNSWTDGRRWSYECFALGMNS